jgi:putative oxidoreductase
MKIAVLIARILLGLVFFVFGLNKFLHFIPAPIPPGLAGQYFVVLFQSHILFVVATIEIISGALLLVNRYVTLALVLLGPIIVNILLFHGLLAPSGLPVALVVAILWFILAYHARRNLAGIFAQRVEA